MASVLKANTNTAGSGLTKGVSADSGNISANAKAGVGPRRLTYGGQSQATNPCNTPTGTVGGVFCDSTAGVTGNYIYGSQPVQQVITATLTNSSVATSGSVSTGTFIATNTFVAGQTVLFRGLTNATALNNLCGVVTSTGLSSSGFQATLTGFTAGTVGSATETGTAAVIYQARGALLSQSANE
jgi:hypothetical protein